MHSYTQDTDTSLIAHLNQFLLGERTAVESYQQAIKRLPDGPTEEFTANRDCHQRRVELLQKTIIQRNGAPMVAVSKAGEFASVDQSTPAPITPKQVVALLEDQEERGVHHYRFPGSLEPTTIQLIQNVLLPRQLETHERMQIKKSRMV